MRHIPLHNNCPDPDWCERAATLLDQLKAAPDVAARHELIDGNTSLWRELKEWLLALSHGKCWFSEARDCFSYWDVEHFRPKKNVRNVRGSSGEGYWWLAFDWHNFRICGNVGNRKKGAYFPLRDGCPHVGPLGDLRYEQPLLLDPADEDDPNLLFFNLEGEAIPEPHVTDAWERDRVEYSVERYKLDYPPLSNSRKLVWAECWSQVQQYLAELARYQGDPANAIAREGMRNAARAIRKMLREESEFSSVARACIESSGDPRVQSLLRTA
ncbi:hypothetical protein [Synechococcus sp. CBW1006]|uniref:hypothetical protein n=1 Tax=Synechococcus sp. CBW1006 TaxID=1353138 RepID=UPI0018CC9722|nr:hypothetical protein [Synechococcus sp. CBW1006]QPN66247.1 hypothetical protein H8F26_15830 [Synechococcus sp. CBW1006]